MKKIVTGRTRVLRIIKAEKAEQVRHGQIPRPFLCGSQRRLVGFAGELIIRPVVYERLSHSRDLI